MGGLIAIAERLHALDLVASSLHHVDFAKGRVHVPLGASESILATHAAIAFPPITA
jgi:hypothetical protein